tara:strand:- start:25637 stop:25846 length:210 start_codon:yes stop_codon:yes gene_type:complete
LIFVDWRIILKDWRDKARGDLDAPESTIILQQSLFYMEEVKKMLQKKNPNIPDIINFLEYNIKILKEEL